VEIDINGSEGAPAQQCAGATRQSETSFREKKTYLRRSGRVLRSKSPEMVRQEIWALLLTHYAVRKLMCRAADEAGYDPDRLSFTRSLRVIRRQVTDQADFFSLNGGTKHFTRLSPRCLKS
jgi:hypothetical protein